MQAILLYTIVDNVESKKLLASKSFFKVELIDSSFLS